jgi:MtfA peptidase
MIFGILRWFRRRRLSRKPFPPEWITILEDRVPFYAKMSSSTQKRLRDLLKVFAEEKYFISAGDMEITDEVRVIISACAVRLIINLDLSFYNDLTEIIVYPYVYKHPDSNTPILGQASHWGTIVLSWPSVISGITDPKDGHDTALHEFAHVLDHGDGVFDGTPELRARSHYRPWALVMSDHYLKLRSKKKIQRKVLRRYGATNEAEFFAVASESYFEKPVQMKKRTPDLYEEMQRFYGGDPAEEWAWDHQRKKKS